MSNNSNPDPSKSSLSNSAPSNPLSLEDNQLSLFQDLLSFSDGGISLSKSSSTLNQSIRSDQKSSETMNDKSESSGEKYEKDKDQNDPESSMEKSDEPEHPTLKKKTSKPNLIIRSEFAQTQDYVENHGKISKTLAASFELESPLVYKPQGQWNQKLNDFFHRPSPGDPRGIKAPTEKGHRKSDSGGESRFFFESTDSLLASSSLGDVFAMEKHSSSSGTKSSSSHSKSMSISASSASTDTVGEMAKKIMQPIDSNKDYSKFDDNRPFIGIGEDSDLDVLSDDLSNSFSFSLSVDEFMKNPENLRHVLHSEHVDQPLSSNRNLSIESDESIGFHSRVPKASGMSSVIDSSIFSISPIDTNMQSSIAFNEGGIPKPINNNAKPRMPRHSPSQSPMHANTVHGPRPGYANSAGQATNSFSPRELNFQNIQISSPKAIFNTQISMAEPQSRMQQDILHNNSPKNAASGTTNYVKSPSPRGAKFPVNESGLLQYSDINPSLGARNSPLPYDPVSHMEAQSNSSMSPVTISQGYVSSPQSSSSSTSNSSKKNKPKSLKYINRGNYKCGKCGMPKVNHVCPYEDVLTANVGTQSAYPILFQESMKPFFGEKLLTVNRHRRSIMDPMTSPLPENSDNEGSLVGSSGRNPESVYQEASHPHTLELNIQTDNSHDENNKSTSSPSIKREIPTSPISSPPSNHSLKVPESPKSPRSPRTPHSAPQSTPHETQREAEEEI